MKNRLYNLMCEADLESGCVYGDCDLKFIADYLIDSGLVITLPCKVGDTVYAIINKKIVCDEVDRIEINSSCCKVSTKKHSWLCNIEDVLTTSEEAEAKLAELKGE